MKSRYIEIDFNQTPFTDAENIEIFNAFLNEKLQLNQRLLKYGDYLFIDRDVMSGAGKEIVISLKQTMLFNPKVAEENSIIEKRFYYLGAFLGEGYYAAVYETAGKYTYNSYSHNHQKKHGKNVVKLFKKPYTAQDESTFLKMLPQFKLKQDMNNYKYNDNNENYLVFKFFTGKQIKRLSTEEMSFKNKIQLSLNYFYELKEKIHLYKLSHGDLNSENILVDTETLAVHIIDVGKAKRTRTTSHAALFTDITSSKVIMKKIWGNDFSPSDFFGKLILGALNKLYSTDEGNCQQIIKQSIKEFELLKREMVIADNKDIASNANAIDQLAQLHDSLMNIRHELIELMIDKNARPSQLIEHIYKIIDIFVGLENTVLNARSVIELMVDSLGISVLETLKNTDSLHTQIIISSLKAFLDSIYLKGEFRLESILSARTLLEDFNRYLTTLSATTDSDKIKSEIDVLIKNANYIFKQVLGLPLSIDNVLTIEHKYQKFYAHIYKFILTLPLNYQADLKNLRSYENFAKDLKAIVNVDQQDLNQSPLP